MFKPTNEKREHFEVFFPTELFRIKVKNIKSVNPD